MRYIQKGQEPESFTQWKALENQDWHPTYDDLKNPEKGDVHQALLAEQGGLCCYCEGEIALTDSHIEHLLSQEFHEEEALNFNNMLCSCGLSHKGQSMPDHCGNAKGNKELPITPLMPDCGNHFLFSSDGKISPSKESDAAAIETIKILHLDCDELTERRKYAIDALMNDDGVDDWDTYARNFIGDGNVEYISCLLAVMGKR